jgi:hypothetical protein
LITQGQPTCQPEKGGNKPGSPGKAGIFLRSVLFRVDDTLIYGSIVDDFIGIKDKPGFLINIVSDNRQVIITSGKEFNEHQLIARNNVHRRRADQAASASPPGQQAETYCSALTGFPDMQPPRLVRNSGLLH